MAVANLKQHWAHLSDRVKNTRVGRVMAWFWACNGGQLSAAIAYQTLFSLFAILTLGWSIFAASLGRYPIWKDAVLDQINGWIPGLIGEEGTALVTVEQLVLPSAVNWASIVAVVMGPVWIYRVMTAVRTAICRLCGVSRYTDTRVWDQISKFLGFLILLAGVLLGAAATVGAQALSGLLLETFGDQLGSVVGFATQIFVAIFGALINSVMIVGAIRLVARVWFVSDEKRRQVWLGGMAGGFVLSLLRWLGASLLSRVALGNPILAPFAAIITILLLANFTVYVLLLVCAWVYDPPRLDLPKSTGFRGLRAVFTRNRKVEFFPDFTPDHDDDDEVKPKHQHRHRKRSPITGVPQTDSTLRRL